jgi:hypothetical protein
MRKPQRRIARRYAMIAVGALATGMVGLGASPASAVAGDTEYVSAASVSTSGKTPWVADPTLDGAYAFGSAPDTTQALNLSAPTGSDGIRILKRLDPRPTDVSSILGGASYTYTGSDVNFQLELFFTPADSQYGPEATDPTKRCTPAIDDGSVLPGQCYTVIKWEPLSTAAAWKTVELTADTAVDSATGTAGWKNTDRIGQYAKPGPLVGNTLSEYLTEMRSYTVIGAGVALGSGTAGVSGWVKDLAIGGVDYRFADAPVVNTTTELQAPSSVVAGWSGKLTATVSPSNASGVVTFFDDTTSLGSSQVDAGGAALAVSGLTAGAHALHAEFMPASGSGFAASTSAVATVQVNVEQAPAAPPAASDQALDELIQNEHLDVEATTASFVPDGNALSDVDAGKPFAGDLPWAAPADSFVDLYAYSSPLFIGTFPVVDGRVQLNGIDLSALDTGDHHLVFVGQTSGTTAAMALTITTAADSASGAAGLADTGLDTVPLLLLSLLVLLLGGCAVMVGRRFATR